MYYMHRDGKKYDDSLRAALFSCLGAVFRKRGSADAKHYTRAETWLSRALEIQERQLKANPTDRARFDLAVTLCNLGELYSDYHKDYERAREFLTRALELKREIHPSFPKIKLHLAKSCGMLAKTIWMYDKSKDIALLQPALNLQWESIALLEWCGEPEARADLAELHRTSAEMSYDDGNIKKAIYHQLAARDCILEARNALEKVEEKSGGRYSKPRGAGFARAALNCELADVCEQISNFYYEDGEVGKARFYSEYADRKRSKMERIYNG
jgi:tetratricopeptide (TPR) repeat protein